MATYTVTAEEMERRRRERTIHGLPTPKIVEVKVFVDDPTRPGGISVHPIWAVEGFNLDRPDTGGWGVPNTPAGKKLAARLKAALLAGVATGEPTLMRDNAGQSYVSADHKVMGRYMNADLKRLGF